MKLIYWKAQLNDNCHLVNISIIIIIVHDEDNPPLGKVEISNTMWLILTAAAVVIFIKHCSGI